MHLVSEWNRPARADWIMQVAKRDIVTGTQAHVPQIGACQSVWKVRCGRSGTSARNGERIHQYSNQSTSQKALATRAPTKAPARATCQASRCLTPTLR